MTDLAPVLAHLDADTRDRFYRANFEDLWR